MARRSKADCGVNGTPLADEPTATDVKSGPLLCLRCGDPGKSRKLVTVKIVETDGAVCVDTDGKLPLCDACFALPGKKLYDWYEGYLSRAEVT